MDVQTAAPARCKPACRSLSLEVQVGHLPPVVRLYDGIESKRNFADLEPDGRAVLLLVHEGPATVTAAEVDAAVDGHRHLLHGHLTRIDIDLDFDDLCGKRWRTFGRHIRRCAHNLLLFLSMQRIERNVFH